MSFDVKEMLITTHQVHFSYVKDGDALIFAN